MRANSIHHGPVVPVDLHEHGCALRDGAPQRLAAATIERRAPAPVLAKQLDDGSAVRSVPLGRVQLSPEVTLKALMAEVLEHRHRALDAARVVVKLDRPREVPQDAIATFAAYPLLQPLRALGKHVRNIAGDVLSVPTSALPGALRPSGNLLGHVLHVA